MDSCPGNTVEAASKVNVLDLTEANDGVIRRPFRKSSWSVVTSMVVHAGLLGCLAIACLPFHRSPTTDLLIGVTVAPDVEVESISFESHATAFLEDSNEPTDHSSSASTDFGMPDIELDLFDEPVNASFGMEDWLATGRVASAAEGLKETMVSQDYRTSFFGIAASGKRFVYVLDMSTSMKERTRRGATRFEVAAQELLRSVGALHEEQEFLVVLFCYRTFFLTDGQSSKPKLLKATSRNKSMVRGWLYQAQLAAGTDPRFGTVTGLKLKPDAIFLLSDGEFNGRKKNRHGIPGNPHLEQLIATHRQGNTPIHTVAYADEDSRARLARIAMGTGGKHRFVGD